MLLFASSTIIFCHLYLQAICEPPMKCHLSPLNVRFHLTNEMLPQLYRLRKYRFEFSLYR